MLSQLVNQHVYDRYCDVLISGLRVLEFLDLTRTLTDIKDEILKQINSDWSRKWGAPLQL
jgi:hypothetical protein